MPYKVKKGTKCVYNKNTNKKVGCTKGSINKYLRALYANTDESLQEIQVRKSVPNHLDKLLTLQSQITHSNDSKVKQELALKCAELVLPIWNFYYPNDNRVRNCIEVTKKFLKGEASVEEVRKAASAAFHAAANAAAHVAAADAANAAANAAAYAASAATPAIKATKSFFKIDESLLKILNEILLEVEDKTILSSNPKNDEIKKFHEVTKNLMKILSNSKSFNRELLYNKEDNETNLFKPAVVAKGNIMQHLGEYKGSNFKDFTNKIAKLYEKAGFKVEEGYGVNDINGFEIKNSEGEVIGEIDFLKENSIPNFGNTIIIKHKNE